jgi:transcriptional regulator with XRE-family HTH domain
VDGSSSGSDVVASRLLRELLLACAISGLTQRQIAQRAGISRSQLNRVLTSQVVPGLDLAERLSAAVGHRLSMRLVPADGVRLRDAGQVGIAQHIAAQAHPSLRVRLEVPVARPPDLRAADMTLDNARAMTMVEIERWLRDWQAQGRRAQLKRTALSELVGRKVDLVLAVPDTPSNRQALEPYAGLVRDALPVSSRRIWAAIRNGDPLDGDGLLWLVQPDESGLDSSPKFDPVWGRRSHANWGFPWLVARNRRLGWDARRARDRGWPVLCEVATNVLWALARLAHGESSITPALVDRLWDERRRLFLDEVQPGGARPGIETWAALAPLALPDLPEEIGRRLVAEHLLDRERFWLPVPPASVSAREPTFEPNRGPGWKRRYWRGPTWVNAAWLLWLGLARLDYRAEAAEMANRLGAIVAREGLREYYDPFTGEGLGAQDFGWTSLVLELADPGSGAGSSYL